MENPPRSPRYTSDYQYFAAQPIDELLPYLISKISDYYSFALKYRFLDRWRRSYYTYYGISQSGTDSSRLNQAGENGEQFVLKCNDTRSLLQSLLTMVTTQRPALQPKAINTDSKSLNETILARTVLDYYMMEKSIETIIKDATEFSLFGGDGAVVLDWNATDGQIYGVDPDTKAPIYDGDIEAKAFHAIDIVREVWGENAKTQWYIIREFKNKYDLAAKYPHLAEKILKISEASDFMHSYSQIVYDQKTNDDYIPVWTFRHEKSEAVPNGRMVKFVGNDIWLTDGPLPFKNLSVYPVMPAQWHGTPFGYTVAYDLMGIQYNLDALNSVIATGQMNYGLQNVLLPRGGEYNVYSLAQGLNGIEYDAKVGEPKPLNLLSTPRELFENISRLEHKQETLSGINAVSRGNIEREMSGSALALVASQAIQYNAGLQESYNQLCERVGTGIIEFLQEFATTPRIASIAGKSNRARIKEFKGSDLSSINRVVCEQVNPVSKTAAGRLQMAQDLIQNHMVTTPQHYFEVLTTGTLDTMYEHETSQMLLVRSENEDMSDGKSVQVMVTDKHKLHIQEHAAVLDSPETRSNPQIAQLVTQHIQEHIQILKTADPALLALLGEQSLAPQASPPMQPVAPTGIPQQVNATPPQQQQAQHVKQPAKPNLPSLPAQSPPPAQNALAQIKANTNQ